MLRIKTLELTNWINIAGPAKFDFDHSLNIISGRSTSGKSALLEAINVCISSKKRSNTYLEYIKQGADKATIRLDTLIGNEPALFNATVNSDRRGGAFAYTIDYKGKTYKNTDATELLESLDIEYYSNIIMSMQHGKDVVDMGPNETSLYLQRLLNFDFTNQKERVKADVDTLNNRLTALKNDVAVKTTLIQNNTKKIVEVKQLDPNIHKQEQELKLRITELTKELQNHAVTQDEIRSLNTQLATTVDKTTTITNEIAALNEELQRHEQIVADIKRTTDEIAQLNLQLDTLEKTVVELNDETTKLNEQRSTIVEKVQKLSDEFDIVDKERQEHADWLSLVEEGKCHHCGQDVTEHVSQLFTSSTSTSFSIESLKANVSALLEKANKLQLHKNTAKDDLLKTTAKFDAKKNELTSQISAQALYTAQVQRLKDVLAKTVVEDCSELKAQVNTKVKEKTTLEEAAKQYRAQIVKLAETESASDINSQLQLLQTQLRGVEEMIAESLRVEDANKQLTLENDILTKKCEEIEADVVVVKKELDVRNDAYKIFDKDLPNYMVVKTCESLQAEMNNVIHSIFPEYTVKLETSKKGTEFFYTKSEGDEKRVNAWINVKMSSGAERALLSLSFKVSLCKLYGLQILLLDEIDRGADDDSSVAIMNTLLDTTDFSQIFIITHRKRTIRHLSFNEDTKIYLMNNGVPSDVESDDDYFMS